MAIINKQRRRPLKQICDCHKPDFRLVWWHPTCTHNDHIWICLSCKKMSIEWIPAGWPRPNDNNVQAHQTIDEHGSRWTFLEWDSKYFKIVADPPLYVKSGHAVAILARD